MTVLFSFYPLDDRETQNPPRGLSHVNFNCGACGQSTNGRLVAEGHRGIDGTGLWFCVCSCPRGEPTILIHKGRDVIGQIPMAREFRAGANWPPDLAKLFEEAVSCYGAGAHTAVAMVARKILMACACHEGAKEGMQFAAYVEFITTTVLQFPKAKAAIDRIRNIGNEANHQVQFVSQGDAKGALSIVEYMLNAIYSLPSA